MSSRVEVVLTDDFDGSKAIGTFTFAWNGYRYEIDLSEQHWEELDEALAPFVKAGRRLGRLNGTGPRLNKPAKPPVTSQSQLPSPAAPFRAPEPQEPQSEVAKAPQPQITEIPATGKEENALIREYFAKRGVQIAERGRIPQRLREEWEVHKAKLGSQPTNGAKVSSAKAHKTVPTGRAHRA